MTLFLNRYSSAVIFVHAFYSFIYLLITKQLRHLSLFITKSKNGQH